MDYSNFDTVETNENGVTVATVASGGYGRISVNDETLEGVILDVTATNSRCKIVATGEFTLKNIGIRGRSDVDTGYAAFGLVPDGDSRIENVYMADGSVGSGAGSAPTAMWMSPNSSGDLTVERCNIAHWADNGLYFSSGHDGQVTVRDSAVENCGNANFRFGTPGARMVNCASIGGPRCDRGVWGWYRYDIHVEDCVISTPNAAAFWAGASTGQGTTLHVTDTDWKGAVKEPYGTVRFHEGNTQTPDETWRPDGIPMSAEEAATGTSSDDGTDDGSDDGSEGCSCSDTSSLENRVTELEDQVMALHTANESLRTRLSTVENRLQDHDTRINSMRTRFEEVVSDVRAALKR